MIPEICFYKKIGMTFYSESGPEMRDMNEISDQLLSKHGNKIQKGSGSSNGKSAYVFFYSRYRNIRLEFIDKMNAQGHRQSNERLPR